MVLDSEVTKTWLNFEQFKEKYQKVPVKEYPNNVHRTVQNPLVSVHIITYQHTDYIRDAIEGVLMQETNFPFEIIIGDDESTDGTREVCIEYAKKYPDLIRLFLHKRENNIAILGKPSHIFQYAFNSYNLRGKYVAICSGDDYWTDQLKLQKQRDFLENNKNYSLCYHRVKEKTSKKVTNIKEEGFPIPCTVLSINIFKDLPHEFFNSINEDKFVYQILECYGSRKFLKSIKASVRRVHENSIWSSYDHDYKFKLDHSLSTQYELYKAFKNTSLRRKLAIAYLKVLYGKSKLVKNRLLFIFLEAKKKNMIKYVAPMFISMFSKYLYRALNE